MNERYVREDHPGLVGLVNNGSNLWKKMWNIKSEVEPKLLWIIGKGNVDIIMDRWLDMALLSLDARSFFIPI